jgi:hypothetical protein
MNKFWHALKIGYRTLHQVEAAGVPLPKIKGIPIDVIDQAASGAAKKIIEAHDAGKLNATQPQS